MDTQTISAFSILGISVRTTNEHGQMAKDIPALWNRFITEQIAEKIPEKTDDTVYCIYTDYEKDHTKPYTVILGCKVPHLKNIPSEMTGRTFNTAVYTKFTAKGNMLQGSVYNEWTKIWASDLARTYTADFEVYGEKAQNPENAEVDIFIAMQHS